MRLERTARGLWLSGFLFVGVGVCPVLAGKLPEPKGRINDFAGILQESTRQTLRQKSAVLEQSTSDELEVVTVSSLEGTTVEDYAVRLFHQWGIGKKSKDNGVLILVAPKERKVRIEVGYGLEAILPDSLAGDVIRNQMTPAFKVGDFDRGVLGGAERVSQILMTGKPAEPGTYREREDPSSMRFTTTESFGALLFLSLFVGIGFFMFGAGLGSKTGFPIMWGSIFGGVPILMGLTGAFGLASRWGLPPLALLLSTWGFRIGRKPKNFLRNVKFTGSHTDGWTWGASGSGGGSGGGGGFGGGSSGGGGASGSW